MTTLRIKGGKVVDPLHAANGAVRDIGIRDGRIVALDARETVDHAIDASGCVVLAGGIDLHSHIGGGKMNLARLLLPEDHRAGLAPSPLPSNPLELPSCGTCIPGTLATGYRYAEMGYTAAFEPAMVAGNARHAHMEMGDVPILDHGAYVMLGNDELFLELLHKNAGANAMRDYVAAMIHATKAMGVKVVNPGGISAFKFNQRKLDVDEQHVHWQVTPRQIVATLSQAIDELGLAHPLHIHGSNLGVPGNIKSTLEIIDALEGRRAHLTHVQFHVYGTDGPKKFSSEAAKLIDALKANPNVSIDVGQILFQQTVTASGDTMRQHANSGLANPRKWIGADIECDAGCGVVPFRYKEQSYVNALQWAIGLELFLLMPDPWRIVLTTDHPNGAPFTSYPHLIRLLMDKAFRDEQLAKLHPDVAANCALKEMKRELTLDDIAVMTRCGPAKLLGLRDRGHLGEGAVADVAIYREAANPEAMFTQAAWVLKDGVVVVKNGDIVATPAGGVHFAQPGYDDAIHDVIDRGLGHARGTFKRYTMIGRDELCTCGNFGRLLPAGSATHQ